MSLSIRLALRYLFKQKLGSFSNYASWLAIGGLSIGITALMLTASIIEGFENTLSKKLTIFEGEARIKNIFGKKINLSNTYFDSLIVNTSANLNPFIRETCLLRSGMRAEGIIVEGNDKLPLTKYLMQQGKLNQGEIIIGRILAENLGVKVGDQLFLQSFSSGINISNLPKIKTVLVSNIFSSGLKDYDNILTFMNMEDAKFFFDYAPNEVTGLILNFNDLSASITDLKYPYFVETWKEKHALLFQWISIQRWPAYIMFGLISFVGLVNLIAAIAMIIIEKSHQIGILYSQGFSKIKIQQIFIYQGGFIGLIGSLIGGVISSLIIFLQQKYRLMKIPTDIYFMDQIPFSFNFSIFLLIIFFVLIFSVFISWFPTKSITDKSPTNLLRHE